MGLGGALWLEGLWPYRVEILMISVWFLLPDWPSKWRQGKVTTCDEMDGLHPGRTTSRLVSAILIIQCFWYPAGKEKFIVTKCSH